MKIKKRNSLWFDKYQYCARVTVQMAYMLRDFDHARIDFMIDRQRQWNGLIGGYKPDVDVEKLHRLCDHLKGLSGDHKLMFSGTLIYIYTNDQDLLKELSTWEELDKLKLTFFCVELFGTAGAVNLRNPTHKFRTYLRNIKLSDQQRESLGSYLQAQNDVTISPALSFFIRPSSESVSSYRSTRTQDYFFINHDSPGSISMLNLIVPNIIRKTLPITAYK